MSLKLITAPPEAPVTLAEAKLWCKVDGEDDDTLMQGLIDAAVAHLDGAAGHMGICLVVQTWDQYLDAFPSGAIKLRLPPLQEVTGVYYIDANGDEQTLDADEYTVDDKSTPAWLLPGDNGWPSTMDTANAVRIRFVAGYEADEEASPPDYTSQIPADIKIAIKALIAHWYANREPVAPGALAPLPMHIDALLAKYRQPAFG